VAPASQGAMNVFRVGLQPLAQEIALRIDDPLRVAARPGGEDDRRGVVGGEVGDARRGFLGLVLIEDLGDVREVHRRHAAGQLAEQLLLPDAELRLCSPDSHLEILASQLRVARHRHGSHPEAGQHGQHPLDPAPDQGHDGVAALNPAGRHRAREPGAPGDQLAEMPLMAHVLPVDRDDPQPRGLGALHHVLDEVHTGRVPEFGLLVRCGHCSPASTSTPSVSNSLRSSPSRPPTAASRSRAPTRATTTAVRAVHQPGKGA
jgi:hypothetical protein